MLIVSFERIWSLCEIQERKNIILKRWQMLVIIIFVVVQLLWSGHENSVRIVWLVRNCVDWAEKLLMGRVGWFFNNKRMWLEVGVWGIWGWECGDGRLLVFVGGRWGGESGFWRGDGIFLFWKECRGVLYGLFLNVNIFVWLWFGWIWLDWGWLGLFQSKDGFGGVFGLGDEEFGEFHIFVKGEGVFVFWF